MSAWSPSLALKTIVRPSGDQAGFRDGSAETIRTSLPSAFITETWSSPPVMNTIFDPSGDQAGSESYAPGVSCVSPDPSALTTSIWPAAAKTILSPAGDQEGQVARMNPLLSA